MMGEGVGILRAAGKFFRTRQVSCFRFDPALEHVRYLKEKYSREKVHTVDHVKLHGQRVTINYVKPRAVS